MKVIILTKSDKNGELCVAGINVDNDCFVRLVSKDIKTHYAIPQWCMSAVNVLDVIDVSVVRTVPSFCQRENIEVRLERWKPICRVSLNSILRKVNNTEPFIFDDNCFFLDEETAQKMPNSIMMVKVGNLNVSVNQYEKTKASFVYNNVLYENMSITDQEFYNIEGQYNNAILVISIPDIGHSSKYYPEKRCYKFVSKIFLN